MFTLQELHDEIENDPLALGYKEVGGEWKEDQVIADLINAKDYKVDKAAVEQADVRAATTYNAYNDLLADRQEWLVWMTPTDGPFPVTADMKLQLSGRALTVDGAAGIGTNGDSFWSAAEEDAMAPAMLALIEVDGSRAEVLWGHGVTVALGDIGRAENL